MVVSFAAQAFAGTELLVENSDDVLSVLGTEVLGSPLDKLLIIAVLTSAAASTQTTILPTARTSLSIAQSRRCSPSPRNGRCDALPAPAPFDRARPGGSHSHLSPLH